MWAALSKRLPAGCWRLNCNHCSHNFSASLHYYEYDDYRVEYDNEYDEYGVSYNDEYDDTWSGEYDEYDDTWSGEYEP